MQEAFLSFSALSPSPSLSLSLSLSLLSFGLGDHLSTGGTEHVVSTLRWVSE